jgi:hypothetical protein
MYGCPYREVTHVSELMLACSWLMKNGVWLVKYISSAIGNSCFVPFNKENLKNFCAVIMQLLVVLKDFKSEVFMYVKRPDGEDFYTFP